MSYLKCLNSHPKIKTQKMALNPLTAITPIDGRYNNKTSDLQAYFSESALIKFRIQVEIEYFIALCNSSHCSWPVGFLSRLYFKKI